MEEKKILGPDGKEIKKIEKVEKIVPEDVKEKIDEKRKERQALLNEYLDVSLQRASAIKREQELLHKLENVTKSLNSKIEYAASKLKLKDDKDYSYKYSSDGKFVGYPKKKKA